jgi:hypothetical protein
MGVRYHRNPQQARSIERINTLPEETMQELLQKIGVLIL